MKSHISAQSLTWALVALLMAVSLSLACGSAALKPAEPAQPANPTQPAAGPTRPKPTPSVEPTQPKPTPSAEPTQPKPTPSAEPTRPKPTLSVLKPGHWANENGTRGEAQVSFDLSDAGDISNFEMTASFGTPRQACTIKIDRPQMQVNKDGTFVISYSMEYADVEKELGAALMSLGIIPAGKPYKVLHISGNTTDTTMNGNFEINVCGHALYLGNNTGPWKAEWKNPSQSAEPVQPANSTQPLELNVQAAKVILTAPDTVMAMSADTKDNVYAVIITGEVLKIAPDGTFKKLYSGLKRCGFSDRIVAALPDGSVVVNDCVDKKDTLIKIDQEGNKSTLAQLEDSLTSMAADASGKLYVGFWTSVGDISVNFQPSYLAGADDLSGHIAEVGPAGQLESVYEGGIPLSLAAAQDGLYAAIWGQKGPFRPEAKSYTMCGPTKNFWIGFSEQTGIQRLAFAPGAAEVYEGVFSHLTATQAGVLFAFGKIKDEECGIYQIQAGQPARKLSLGQDKADKKTTTLTVSDNYLYFADVEGNVYQASLRPKP